MVKYKKIYNLSMNTNDNAVKLLIKNQTKINWKGFSLNSNNKVIKFLKEQNPNKIVFSSLSLNTNDKAIEILLQN